MLEVLGPEFLRLELGKSCGTQDGVLPKPRQRLLAQRSGGLALSLRKGESRHASCIVEMPICEILADLLVIQGVPVRTHGSGVEPEFPQSLDEDHVLRTVLRAAHSRHQLELVDLRLQELHGPLALCGVRVRLLLENELQGGPAVVQCLL